MKNLGKKLNEILLVSPPKAKRNLTEDDGGDFGDFGDWGGDWGGGGGYGGFEGNLYKVFVEPFVDVVKVTAGAVEDVTSKTRSLIETIVKGVISLAYVGMSAEYEKIKNAEKERSKKIEKRYANVFKNVNDAFKGDALGFAFMLAPGTTISTLIARKSAVPVTKGSLSAILGLIDTATGRVDPVINKTDKIRSFFNMEEVGTHSGGEKNDNSFNALVSSLKNESANKKPVLLEKKDNKQQAIAKLLKALINNQEVQDALKKSKVLKSMEEDAKSHISSTLMPLISLSDKAMNAKSLDELGSVLNKDLTPKELEKMESKEKSVLEKQLLEKTKEALKKSIKTIMKNEAEELLKQGLSSDHPYVVAYKRAMEKV